MPTVVGVKFRTAGKTYYFDPKGLKIEPDEDVIVETARGVEHGVCVTGLKEVAEEEVVRPLKPVLRSATEDDLLRVNENSRKESEAFGICLEKIAKHGLDMNLVDVEYTFDNSKVIFYFTADGRVDFRQLVRDLASVFKTRIELRQIGVRDEAKMLGGLGPCGRELCCKSFLQDFEPISIKMAKNQNLALNPTKISGICGRLMCCLKYEDETYDESRGILPHRGERVSTEQGTGRVVSRNLLSQSVDVELDESNLVIAFGAADIDQNDNSGTGASNRHEAKRRRK